MALAYSTSGSSSPKCDDPHLFRRKPEREVAGVMFDEETDEPLVRAQRRAVDAERRLLGVVLVAVDQAEPFGTAKSTWFVARVNSLPMALQTCTSFSGRRTRPRRRPRRSGSSNGSRTSRTMSSVCFHNSGSSTYLHFSSPARRIVRAETHHVFLDAENLEILQIHLVHRVELLRRTVRAYNRCAHRSCSASARA